MGAHTNASGNYSTALGTYTLASGNISTAIGNTTTASGNSSTAIGTGIEAAGDYTVAIGLNAQTGISITQNNTMAIMGGKVGIGTISPTATMEIISTGTNATE